MSDTLQMLEPFDYTTLDAPTRELVQRTTDETQQLLRRTAENIIAIGENLRLVQEHLPPMAFSAWLRAEFALSRQTAYNYMHVAARFSESCQMVLQLPARVLYALATCPEEIVEQVEAGQIPPTLAAIRTAKAAEAQAREAQALADLETQQVALDALTIELEEARQQLEALSIPLIEVQEVERLVVPPELVSELEQAQADVQTLASEREVLTRQIADLEAQLAAAASARLEGAEEQRIHLNWYRITSEFGRSMRTLLSRWPSPLDTQAFTADDWTRLSQSKALARRFLDECDQLAHSRIVDAVREPVSGVSPERPL